jgi:tetratricopeptide (TPR) repeat protein
VLVSLCVIARDEAATLKRCLDSTATLADERIVLDTGSVDDTVAVATAAGARVERFTWVDDFAAARNACVAHARGRWIVFLDADEFFEPAAAAALRARLEREAADGLQLVARNLLPPGDMLAWSEFPLVRVFRNDPRYRYEGRIHEQIGSVIARNGGRIVRTDIRFIHTGYQTPTAQGGVRRAERNLRALEAALTAAPDDVYLHYQIGATLKALGRGVEARRALERAVGDKRGALGRDLLVEALGKLSQLCWSLGDGRAANQHAAAALALAPDDAIALSVHTLTLVELGRPREALPGLRALTTHPAVNAAFREQARMLIRALGG